MATRTLPTIFAVVVAVSLAGCVDPARRAADQRFANAVSQMSRADRAECELLTSMRPHSPDQSLGGLIEDAVSSQRTHDLCLKAKLYRAGYAD